MVTGIDATQPSVCSCALRFTTATTGVMTEGSAGNEKPAVEFDGYKRFFERWLVINTNGWTQGSSRNDFSCFIARMVQHQAVWNTDSIPRFSQNLSMAIR